MPSNNDTSKWEYIKDVLDEYEEFVDCNKRDIKSTTEANLRSKVRRIEAELSKDSLEYKRLLMIKEKADKYERELKEKKEEELISQAKSLVWEYQEYERDNKKYPPKNSSLYGRFKSLIKRRNRSKQLDYYIGLLIDWNRYDNPGVDDKIERLQKFYDKTHRLPNQESDDENEKQLGSFVSQFPRYKKINRIVKEKYIDIKNQFINNTLEEAMNYKLKHKQEHLKVPTNIKLHVNIVNVGILLSEIEKEMLKDEKPIHYIEGESERQLEIYEELSIKKARRFSEQEKIEIINKKFLKVTNYIEKYHKYPTNHTYTTKEEQEVYSIINGYTKNNKSWVFSEEQNNKLEELKKKYGGRRGGISYPESIYVISFELLLGSKCTKFYRNEIVDDVNVDLFMEIDGKEYAFFYDGKYYHNNKIKDDKKKTVDLLKKNVVIIRVREHGLDRLGLDDNNLIVHQLTKANVSRDDYIEDIDKVANLIIKDSYKELLVSKWDEIDKRAHAENQRSFTELKHIKDFLDFAYTYNVIPLSNGEGKEIYRNMNNKVNDANKSDYSRFALLVFQLASIIYPAGKRKAWKERLIAQGLNEDVLTGVETFLSPSNE